MSINQMQECKLVSILEIRGFTNIKLERSRFKVPDTFFLICIFKAYLKLEQSL